MRTEHSALRGKIREAGYTIDDFSKIVGIPSSTFTSKLCGKTEFKASEMRSVMEALNVDHKEMYSFFYGQ